MSPEINNKNDINSSFKKRVLFIITQPEMGGAQRFLLNLLNRISNRYDIGVAFGSDGSNGLTDELKLLNIETYKLKSLKRNIDPINDIKACFEIRNLINNYQPDTLFLLSSKAGFIGSLAAHLATSSKQQATRIVYRIGGWSFNDPRPAWERKLWTKFEKLSAGWKNTIIVNNLHDFKQAKKLGIKPKEKIVLIHNGLDPYKLGLLPRDEARLKLLEKASKRSGKIFPAPAGRGLPSQTWRQADFIIGTIANLYKTKGIEHLIETVEYFKNNDNVVFTVIGDGPERKNLELLITNYKLQHKIFLLGQLPDGYRFLPAFDIFVLPSVKEGFPWALIEAMAAKLPVIATRVGAVPEIIENGHNGFLVEPANPAALASKIKDLLVDDHLRQEFSIQGHQTILFKFSEDKMVKEIEVLL